MSLFCIDKKCPKCKKISYTRIKTQMVDASNHLLKIIYFILKEYDQGFKYLDKAFEKKVHTLNALKVDPFLMTFVHIQNIQNC